MVRTTFLLSTIILLTVSCSPPNTTSDSVQAPIKPVIVTDTVPYDTDDPAIWINKSNPEQSLIIGTDKDADGGLFVFNLEGKILSDRTVKDLKRPNNVDIAYGLRLGDSLVDIAVVTERLTHSIRVISLPAMKVIDNGGIPVFESDTTEGFRDPMGIALYTDASGNIYAMVGRKSGPSEGYIGQYKLESDGKNSVKGTLVRTFGKYSGNKEIESIAIDNELGYVYYSDEGVGVRKYYADPSKGNEELALFATTGFTQDHEGISIYKLGDGTGYILVSDQQSNRFQIFPREGSTSNPHDHQVIKIVSMSTDESDGSEVTSIPLNARFASGLFVAMSTNKTFQFFRWEDIAGTDLKVRATNKTSSAETTSK